MATIPNPITINGHSVIGDIRLKYIEYGCETGWLGKPLTSELTAPDQVGRFNFFEHGAIYWTPSTGAQPMGGAFIKLWEQLEWERGPLGYPTSPEQDSGRHGGKTQQFQHGSMYWSHVNQRAYHHIGTLPEFIKESRDYHFPGKQFACQGFSHLTLWRDGRILFDTNFHNATMLCPYTYAMANVVKDADNQAYSFAVKGRVAPHPSQDDKHHLNPQNALIADQWPAIVAGHDENALHSWARSCRVTLNPVDVVTECLKVVGPVLDVLALV